MEDIEHYGIPVYNFPYDVEEDDEETIQDNSELRVCSKMTPHSHTNMFCSRPSCLSLLLALRKRLRLTENVSVLAFIPGAL
jgi:hypothetical protein